MHIRNLYAGGYASCCYFVTDDSERFAVVVDPSVPPSVVGGERLAGVTVCAVLLTHAHYDHMLALFDWRDLGIPICAPAAEADGLGDPVYNVSATVFGLPTCYPPPDRLLSDGDEIRFGTSALTVMETPGHTRGGCTYVGEGNAFCGDTLFADGGIGRYDLSDGSYEALKRSVQRILALPAATVLYPGHGKSTTVARERTCMTE